jgi:hypothetical protein
MYSDPVPLPRIKSLEGCGTSSSIPTVPGPSTDDNVPTEVDCDANAAMTQPRRCKFQIFSDLESAFDWKKFMYLSALLDCKPLDLPFLPERSSQTETRAEGSTDWLVERTKSLKEIEGEDGVEEGSITRLKNTSQNHTCDSATPIAQWPLIMTPSVRHIVLTFLINAHSLILLSPDPTIIHSTSAPL